MLFNGGFEISQNQLVAGLFYLWNLPSDPFAELKMFHWPLKMIKSESRKNWKFEYNCNFY